jgi:methylmalonyl-CoA mutase C-terminal domain/subunit
MVTFNLPLARVGLGMLGLDVHTKGIRTLVFLLRERGCEVIYFGEHLTAKSMIRSSVAEDVDVLGVSFSSNAYLDYCRELVQHMRDQGVDQIPLMIGGLIHKDDHEELRAIGVSGIFGPGSSIDDIVSFIGQMARNRNPTISQTT